MQTILSYGMGVESAAIMWNKKSKPGNRQFEVKHRLRTGKTVIIGSRGKRYGGTRRSDRTACTERNRGLLHGGLFRFTAPNNLASGHYLGMDAG